MMMRANSLRGAGITTSESLALGRSISAATDHRRVRHDWQVTPFWSAKSKRWLCTIKAGFVGGDCPVIRTTKEEQAAGERDFGINPLTGRPFFSDFVFNRGVKTVAPSINVDIPLYLDPALPLVWRNVGFDGVVGAPTFFEKRGVALPPVIQAGGEEGALPDLVPPGDLRLLRDCDLVLHMPRPALTVETQFSAGILNGTTNVRQVLSVEPPDNGDVLQIQATTGFDPAAQPTVDPLAGVFTEQNYDELWLATVYLLSPRRTDVGSEPDGSWTPFVKHRRFFNLMWDRRHTPVAPLVEDLTPYYLPLLGGLAQPLVNTLTAATNDAAQFALNLINGQSLAGHFWTPSGGGHYVNDLPAEPPKKTGGLTKPGRQRAAEAAARAAKAADRLEPDFPWGTDPFPAELLTQ